jgi:DNA-binding IclR family transcriptional regulator
VPPIPVEEALAGGRAEGTTARVVAVLDALARSPEGGVGVRQLSIDLAVSRSAVHRILQSLAELGVARSLRSGGYEAGPMMAAWAAFLATRHSLLSSAGHIMDRLVEQAQEASYLFAFNPQTDSLTVIGGRQCSKPVQYVLELGSTAPLYLGATGKAVLAMLPDSKLNELDFGLSQRKASQFRATLRADLAVTRERGYAVSFGERIPEACGVAAGFAIDGKPAGSLTLTTPQFRMQEENVAVFGGLVRAAVNDLSALLEATPVLDV